MEKAYGQRFEAWSESVFSFHNNAGEDPGRLPGRSNERLFHPCMESMIESKNADCPVCMQLVEQAPRELIHFNCSFYSFQAVAWWQHKSEPHFLIPDIELVFEFTGPWSESKRLSVLVHPMNEPRILFEIAAEASRADSTNDAKVSRLAKHWMADCIENHPECTADTPSTWLPDRLLEIGATRIRLMQGPNRVTPVPYATLSHCWGDLSENPQADKDQVLVLDDESEGILSNGVPIYRLPQTVQDVISTLRTLGFGCFSTECYCVRQRGIRSTEDKLQQNAAIANIFENASLNVSASSARDPFHGCFHPRHDRPAHHHILWRPTSLHSKSYFNLASKPLPNTHDFFGKNMPLMRKDGVLQEHVFSSRILHLCQEQVVWECNHLEVACETHPYGVRGNQSFHAQDWRCRPFRIEKASIDRFWAMFVRLHSRMQVSRPHEDKFSSISAVAKRAATILNDEYIAGLWRKTLLRDLYWVCMQGRRPVWWQAPSWSWASIDGYVMYLPHWWKWASIDDDPGHQLQSFYAPYEYHVSIVDVSLKPVDPANPYGALSSASLTLDGRLLDATNVRRGTMIATGAPFIAGTGEQMTHVTFDEGNLISAPLFLLMLSSVKLDSEPERLSPVSGLLLRRLANGTYERVGTHQPSGLWASAIYEQFMDQEVERITLV